MPKPFKVSVPTPQPLVPDGSKPFRIGEARRVEVVVVPTLAGPRYIGAPLPAQIPWPIADGEVSPARLR